MRVPLRPPNTTPPLPIAHPRRLFCFSVLRDYKYEGTRVIDEPKGRGTEGGGGGIRGERGWTNATEKGLGRRTARKRRVGYARGCRGRIENPSERASSGNKGRIEGETRVRPVGGSTGVNTSRRRTCVRFVERGGVEGGERGGRGGGEGVGGGRRRQEVRGRRLSVQVIVI